LTALLKYDIINTVKREENNKPLKKKKKPLDKQEKMCYNKSTKKEKSPRATH